MTDASHALHKQTQAAKVLLAQFQDLLRDDPEFQGELVDAETDLNEAIDRVVQQIANDMAAVAGIDVYMESFKARKERLKARIESEIASLKG